MAKFSQMIDGIPIAEDRISCNNGNVFFLDPANGNDGNDGKSVERAFKTLAVAYAALTSNQHDRLYYISSNTGISLKATFTWAKSMCHLIGIGGRKHYSNRARFTGHSANVGVSPLFTITGNNNTFDNIMWQYGVADSTSLINVQIGNGTSGYGQRNTFTDCHFMGVNNATMSAAGACDLKLNAAQENEFYNCTIGSNQTTRDGDATNVLWDTGSSMNNFYDCEFIAGVTASAYCMFTVADNSGIAGTNFMKNCVFHHISTNKAITLASLWSIPANMQTAYVYLINPTWATLTTALDANSRGILYCNTPAAVASAAGGKCTNL